MKTGKIIIGALSIIIGIVALIESNDVYRLASSFGVNGFHIYVGFIVGFIFICLGILSLVMMNEQSKKYADIAMPLSSIAIFLCFRGPEIFTDLVFFAIWGVICLIFAIIAFYGTKKEEDEDVNQLTSQSTCPYCHAVVDENSMFCGSCGKKIKKNCPHCGATIIEGDVFCKKCGKNVNEVPFNATPLSAVSETAQQNCPHCGTPYNDGDVFCENCGRNLTDGSIGFTPNVVMQPTYEAEENSSKKIIPIILGVLAVAIVVGGLWYWSSSKINSVNPTQKTQIDNIDSIEEVIDSVVAELSPEEIIIKRVNYIYNEAPASSDFDERFLTKDFWGLLKKSDEVTPEGDIGYIDYDHWSQSQGGNGNPSYVVESAEIQSDKKAAARITIRYSESNESKDVKVVLIREGEDWLIDDFITYDNGREYSEKQGLIDYINSMEEKPIEQFEEPADTVA